VPLRNLHRAGPAGCRVGAYRSGDRPVDR
jgi:hypothetical protein